MIVAQAMSPVVIGLILAGSYLRVFDSFELDTLDSRFRYRPAISVTDKVVIVEIGDDTLAQLGRFPFDRSYHAAIASALREAGAKAVVFDIFFSEESPSDPELAGAMRKAGLRMKKI
jgi:CHASE2 domain-containing sensor protein